MFSSNLRAVKWRTIGWGIALQVVLALLVLKVPIVKQGFNAAKIVVLNFISFSDQGAEFVFGNLARPGDLALIPARSFLFIFAFKALPPILFVSAFFTVLYHYGILQLCVRLLARVMVHLMGTSGAETLSGLGECFYGADRSAVDRQALRSAHDQLRIIRADGQRHGAHLGRDDGRLYQLRGRIPSRCSPLASCLPVQPLSFQIFSCPSLATQ